MERKLKTLNGSNINRSSKFGVGKMVGENVFFHKNYVGMIVPNFSFYHKRLPKGFNYNCLRYNVKTQELAFQEGPDFDTAREPHVGVTIRVFRNGEIEIGRYSNAIWHHKWCWVLDDYRGFNVNTSFAWSKLWLSKFPEPAKGTDKSFNAQLKQFGLGKYIVQGFQGFGMTSSELDNKYPFWRNQTAKKGNHNTTVTITKSTYVKIGEWILKNWRTAKVLDASSGLGLGTQAIREMGINIEDVEPYVSSERPKPTYTDYTKIRKKYDIIISNAVINVIPDDWRDDLMLKMANLLNVGGMLIVNARSAQEIIKTKSDMICDDASEKVISRGAGVYSYQKGYAKGELAKYCQKILGKSFSVTATTKANCGISTDASVLCVRLK